MYRGFSGGFLEFNFSHGGPKSDKIILDAAQCREIEAELQQHRARSKRERLSRWRARPLPLTSSSWVR